MLDVSVEITTYNRKDTLRALLGKLAEQTHPAARFEVILSDDGSTDDLLGMVSDLAPSLPYAIRVLSHDHAGPGHAHNCGIRAGAAEIVLMLAADILPTPVLIAEHLRSHREHPASNVVVAGRLTQSEAMPDTVLQRAVNAQVEKIFRSEADKFEHGGFLVSNLSFKKSFMLAHGMFREWPPASGEDLELGYRLSKAGMQIVRNDRALGFHYHEETLASVIKRAYMAGYNSHHFAEQIDAPWVRRRFGPQADAGLPERLHSQARAALRAVFLNRVTATAIMIPILRLAEMARFLAPAAPLLSEKVAGYFFQRGLADYRGSKPFMLPDPKP